MAAVVLVHCHVYHILAEAMSDDGIQHRHCDSCYWRKCTDITDPPCAVITCDNFCGAAYHECKASEHRKLCLLEKVPCINVENGCPMVLLRRDLCRHLAVCPASVVCCTMEWCRWPMYSREHGTRVPFASTSHRARCGQLDVAIALRDQRTLDRARKYPRRSLIRALRNRFTKRHPTVPLLVGGNPTFVGEDVGDSGEFEFSESEGEDNEMNSRAPWLTSEPPGLQKSILGELFGELPTKSAANGNVSNLAAEDIRCALCSKDGSKHVANSSLCLTAASDTVAQSFTSSHFEHKDCGTLPGDHHRPEFDVPSGLFIHGSKTLQEAGLAHCPMSNQVALQLPDSVSGMSEHSCGIQETDQPEGGGLLPADRNNSNNCLDRVGYLGDKIKQIDDTQAGNKIEAATTVLVMGSVCSTIDGKASCQSSKSLPPTLHEVLAVDLDMVTCARGNVRDPSVYSFTCAQLFRRDEYVRHFCDVHSVINDALNHWLEVRCPLANRGCTFSMHRRLPTGADIIFSPLLESIGLRRSDTSVSSVKESTSKESSSVTCSELPMSEEDVENESAGTTSTDMISQANMPKQVAEPPACSVNGQTECERKMFTSADYESTISVPEENREEVATVDCNPDSSKYPGDKLAAKEPIRSIIIRENGFKEATPEMFTSKEFDSTVCIRPRVSKEPTPTDDSETLCLTDLPYEMLVRVASFLDSFSLCNLSLTCWIFRDVCRSLLRQRGIVVLEWQKDCSQNPPCWKVSHQVSLSVLVRNSPAVIEAPFGLVLSLIVLGSVEIRYLLQIMYRTGLLCSLLVP